MNSPINIAPLGISNSEVVALIRASLEEKFSVPAKVIDLPIDLEIVKSVERGQYYSTKLIAQAIKLTSEYEGKVLLLVDVDIYIPIFTFLFGEAQLNGKHSIVSLCRLHEEFYTGKTDNNLFYARTMKEVFHELGHNFGLLHCEEWDCVMHSSSAIEEVDIKGSYYCKNCLKDINNYK